METWSPVSIPSSPGALPGVAPVSAGPRAEAWRTADVRPVRALRPGDPLRVFAFWPLDCLWRATLWHPPRGRLASCAAGAWVGTWDSPLNIQLNIPFSCILPILQGTREESTQNLLNIQLN